MITEINPIFATEHDAKVAYETRNNPIGISLPDSKDFKSDWIWRGRCLQWHWWQQELKLGKFNQPQK